MPPEQENTSTPIQSETTNPFHFLKQKTIWISLTVIILLGGAYFVIQQKTSPGNLSTSSVNNDGEKLKLQTDNEQQQSGDPQLRTTPGIYLTVTADKSTLQVKDSFSGDSKKSDFNDSTFFVTLPAHIEYSNTKSNLIKIDLPITKDQSTKSKKYRVEISGLFPMLNYALLRETFWDESFRYIGYYIKIDLQSGETKILGTFSGCDGMGCDESGYTLGTLSPDGRYSTYIKHAQYPGVPVLPFFGGGGTAPSPLSESKIASGVYNNIGDEIVLRDMLTGQEISIYKNLEGAVNVWLHLIRRIGDPIWTDNSRIVFAQASGIFVLNINTRKVDILHTSSISPQSIDGLANEGVGIHPWSVVKEDGKLIGLRDGYENFVILTPIE